MDASVTVHVGSDNEAVNEIESTSFAKFVSELSKLETSLIVHKRRRAKELEAFEEILEMCERQQALIFLLRFLMCTQLLFSLTSLFYGSQCTN